MAKKARNKTPPPTPHSLTPDNALALLRRQVEKGKHLLENRPITSAADRAWETATRDVLIRAYGSNSPNVESVMGVGRYRHTFGGGNEKEWEEGRAEDMQERLAIMAELIDLLEHEVGPIISPAKNLVAAGEEIAAPLGGFTEHKSVTVFISYSWDNEPHRNWVRGLADELIRNGVDTILDQYDLPIGGDRFRFMEESVRRSAVVLCVCTPTYVERANDRAKGVGVETSLITPQFFDEHRTKQFIPIIRVKRAGMPPTPDYMRSLIFVDFSNDGNFALMMEELLRHLHRQPKVKKPPLGPVPNFGGSPPASLPAMNVIFLATPAEVVFDRDIIRFAALANGSRILCEISAEALVKVRPPAESTESVSDPKMMLQRFNSAKERIHILACKLIQAGRVENGILTITSADLAQ